MAEVLRTRALREVSQAPGRSAALGLAVLAGALAIGTMMGAFAVLSREITRSYAESAPASATIDLDEVDHEVLALVRARPEVRAAEARATTLMRIDTPLGARRLLLFTVEDFDAMEVGRFAHVSGAWPPAEGEILVERASLAVLGAEVGATLPVRTPGGVGEVRIAGLVHDAGLAPATMEQTAYAYAVPSTLAALGGGGLDQLRIAFTDEDHASVEEIEHEAVGVARALEAAGNVVHDIEVPPPRRHPHQGQMETVILLFVAFGVVTLVLAGMLVANIVVARLASQTREIGVLKAIGARRSQLAAAALTPVVFVCALAGLAAVALSGPAALGFASDIAVLLNFDLVDRSIPVWVPLLVALSAVLVPPTVAALPVLRALRVSVRDALDASGTGTVGPGALDRSWSSSAWMDAGVSLALRNALRKKAWALTTIAQLGTAGATFVTALGVSAGWQAWADEVEEQRHYDIELAVRPDESAAARATLEALPEVTAVEAWGEVDVAVDAGAGMPISRTYPDGGHGSFRMLSAPTPMRLLALPLIEGRWVESGAEAVVNELGARRTNAWVGDSISVVVAGRARELRVVGVAHEAGSGAAAYVSPATLEDLPDDARRVVLRAAADGSDASMARITAALDDAGIVPSRIVPMEMLRTAVGEHVGILTVALVALSLLMALVGGIGVGAATLTATIERSRETGVLRAIGASPGFVVRSFVLEASAVGLVSAIVAVLAALPLTAALGGFLGRMSFGSPLPFVVSPAAVVGWVVGVALLTALASAVPAGWAMRTSVRRALDAT